MHSRARALSAVMTSVLMALLLAGCGGSSTMTYAPAEGQYAVGCNYSANIGTLDGYCTR